MTCIVAIIKKDKVIMGADSAGVSGLDITIRKDPKMFKNKDFLIGCTSSFRMIQLLMFSFKPPEIKNKSLFKYMCTDFIDEVRECFRKGGYLQRELAGDDKGGKFLVAYQNRLFMIDYDFQVEESKINYQSIGSGQKYAMGSLTTTKGLNMSPKKRVKKALQVAAKHNVAVSPPFNFSHT